LEDGTCVTAKYWGITKSQIRELYHDARQSELWNDGDTVNEFVQKFVLPMQGNFRGLALEKNKHAPQEVNLMISHAWAENVKDFFEDVLEHTYEHEVAFVCFLSNYQGTPDEIDRQLGHDIHRSPFTEAIRNCQRMLVVPNEELLRNGQGLYSRLWCDWEIKVAADNGLPIHVTARCTKAHLLGSPVRSSRDARCGDPSKPWNKDERLIRTAIENMPPQTAKFHSVGISLVAICASYGPLISCRMRDDWTLWISGVLGGTLVGLALVYLLIRSMKMWLSLEGQTDGYDILDSIIRGAARKSYACKRFHFATDFGSLLISCLLSGFLDNLVKVAWCLARKESLFDHRGAFGIFMCWIEGVGCGFILWIILHLNTMGPLTGVFFVEPHRHRRYKVLLACFVALGCCIGTLTMKADGFGRGAPVGLLGGLSVISFVHEKWLNSLGLASMAAWLAFNYLVTSLAWRESLMMMMGDQHGPAGAWLDTL